MKTSQITHEQRLVLAAMVGERWAERHRMHAQMLMTGVDGKLLPWSQARWDLLSRELTMLYAMLDGRTLKPEVGAPSEADKREFWHECQAQFAKAKVAASKPPRQRTYEPRTDPSLAFGD